MTTKKSAPAKGPGPQPFKGPTPKKKSGGEMLQEAFSGKGKSAPAKPIKKTMANFEKSGADVDAPGADENSPAEKALDKKQFAAWKPGKAAAKKKK